MKSLSLSLRGFMTRVQSARTLVGRFAASMRLSGSQARILSGRGAGPEGVETPTISPRPLLISAAAPAARAASGRNGSNRLFYTEMISFAAAGGVSAAARNDANLANAQARGAHSAWRARLQRHPTHQRNSLDPTIAPRAAQMAMATTYQVVTNATESTGQYMA